MRLLSIGLAIAAGCTSTSYTIRGPELVRLAALPPELRGEHVRVAQELSDVDVGPRAPVTAETQVVFFPQIEVSGPEDHRRVSGWGPSVGGGGPGGGQARIVTGGHGGGVHGGSGLHLGGGGGGGGDGRAEAIALLVVAAVALVTAAEIEGSRYDGYVQLHPMHPLYLFGRDGSTAVMPLAWLDPQSAAFSDHAIVRSNEGPWHRLGRAPLDRTGFTYAMLGGVGTFTSGDGSKALGTATTIQLGYFPEQRVGIVASMFLGWRDNAVDQTLFESRYTAEVEVLPFVAGPMHFGVYGGGGSAYRWDDGIPNGDSGSLCLLGGTLVQLDINTRLALTARFGQTYAHDQRMSDALFGLAVY
jgi:hypothetical protein